MNTIFILGELTRDPEKINKTKSLLVRLNVSEQSKYINANGVRPKQYYNIYAWNHMADNCLKYLKEGSHIAVFGYSHSNTWKNKAGQIRYCPMIIATEIEYLYTSEPKRKKTATKKTYNKNSDEIPLVDETLDLPIDETYPDDFLI